MARASLKREGDLFRANVRTLSICSEASAWRQVHDKSLSEFGPPSPSAAEIVPNYGREKPETSGGCGIRTAKPIPEGTHGTLRRGGFQGGPDIALVSSRHAARGRAESPQFDLTRAAISARIGGGGARRGGGAQHGAQPEDESGHSLSANPCGSSGHLNPIFRLDGAG
jgi:hypothetical protein